MPYTRTPWANYCPPPLDAANLINMEDGIWYGLAHSGGVRNTAEFLDRNPASTTGGLAEAIADLAGGAGVVFAAPHNHPIPAGGIPADTIPATVHLIASRGAVLTIANGVTLTINGTIEAGLYQIFDCVGTGRVNLTGVQEIYPQWWGFSISANAADNTIAFTKAILAVVGGNKIRITQGTFPINELAPGHKELVWEGNGWQCILDYQGTSDFITIPGGWQYGQAVFRNFRITGNVNAGHCFNIGATAGVWNPVWDGMFISGFSKVGSAGIYTKNTYNATIKGGSLILDCYDGTYFTSISYNWRFQNSWVRGFQRYGVAVVGTGDAEHCFIGKIDDCIIDEATGAAAKVGVYIHKGHLIEVGHIHFEGITTGVHINSGINNVIGKNLYAADLTNAFILDVAASGTTIAGPSRYLGGVKVDNGTRTAYVYDDQYSVEGDGGAGGSRTSWGVENSYPGWLLQKAGFGVDLLGRTLRAGIIEIDSANPTPIYWQESGTWKYGAIYTPASNFWHLRTTDGDGSDTNLDVIRIPDGQTDVLGNTDFLDDQFDWVCRKCGWHSGTKRESCPDCGGKVEWQDDALLMSTLSRSPGTLREIPRDLLAQLERLGIFNTFGTLDRPVGEREIFLNSNKAHFFAWSAIAQLWRRVRELEAQIPA